MAHGLEIEHKREFHPFRKLFWLLITLLLLGFVWIGYQYYTTGELPSFIPDRFTQANRAVDESDVSAKQVAEYSVPSTQPKYVSVPKFDGGASRVMPVDVDSNNFVATPKNINDIGWYKKSATPGSGYGTAVITGESKGITKNGVFAKLKDLVAGDKVIVTDGDGNDLTYVIKSTNQVSVQQYAKNGTGNLLKPAEAGKENLTLVTNEGNWVPKLKQFDQKLIVRAVAE